MDYPKVTTLDIFKEYWKSARKHWFLGINIVFWETVGTLLMSIVVPIYYKRFFDTITTGDPSSDFIVTNIVNIVIIIFVINTIASIAYRITTFVQNYYFVRVGRRLVNRAFSYLIEHSYSFFINNFSGSLVQRVGRYHRSFGRIVDRISGDIVPLTVRSIGAIIVLYYVKPLIAIIMFAWIAIFITISYVLALLKLKYDIRSAAADSKLTGTISDAISNHNSIQLFTGVQEEIRLLEISNKNFYNSLLAKWNFAGMIDIFQGMSGIIVEFLVFYYGIKYWQLGVISVGTFVLIQSYIINIGSSMWGFGRVIRDLYEATADAKEMVEIIHLSHEIKNIDGAIELNVSKGLIEFKNVNFAFGKDKSKKVFNNFNININPGEKIALIGSSGAGKSTFVKLLLRMHDINSGEILIDGQNIATVTQESLRKNISLVPQDPALFHRTLMENIRYGNREATDEQVIEASRLAHCDIFIKDLPLKYNTFVGERGVKLSGGERQRVAIARALLKNAPILILDEATSSLDSHSESLIQDALNTLMKGKTTIVIAHRLSTIKKVDRIVVLGKEGIMEQGSHSELLDKNGTYAHLWNIQAGGFADRSIEDLLDK